jgi:hypothetical protein
MNVAPFHEAEHLAGVPADLQRLPIEVAREGVEGRHDVGDRLVAVNPRVGSLGLLRLLPDAGVRLANHLLAVVHADEILLEDVVVEHVLGGFAEIHDPLAHRRRTNAKSHILRVHRANAMVIAADPADARRYEVCVAGILSAHEDAVAAENRRGRMALGYDLFLKIDLRVDSEAADDARDRIPGHLDEPRRLGPANGAG